MARQPNDPSQVGGYLDTEHYVPPRRNWTWPREPDAEQTRPALRHRDSRDLSIRSCPPLLKSKDSLEIINSCPRRLKSKDSMLFYNNVPRLREAQRQSTVFADAEDRKRVEDPFHEPSNGHVRFANLPETIGYSSPAPSVAPRRQIVDSTTELSDPFRDPSPERSSHPRRRTVSFDDEVVFIDRRDSFIDDHDEPAKPQRTTETNPKSVRFADPIVHPRPQPSITSESWSVIAPPSNGDNYETQRRTTESSQPSMKKRCIRLCRNVWGKLVHGGPAMKGSGMASGL